MNDNKKICAFCNYARMKRDICGIYCTGGFENKNGDCQHFSEYELKKEKRVCENE